MNLINRVAPKIVGLPMRPPGVTIRADSGRGFYSSNMLCDTADNSGLRMGVAALHGSLRAATARSACRSTRLPAVREQFEQRKFYMAKSAAAYKEVGPQRLDPAAHLRCRLRVDAAQLS